MCRCIHEIHYPATMDSPAEFGCELYFDCNCEDCEDYYSEREYKQDLYDYKADYGYEMVKEKRMGMI